MKLRALFLISFLFYNFVLCENKSNGKLKSKETITLRGYLHGYKHSQALQLPGYLITPILIVPKLKPQQNEDFQNVSSAENSQENRSIFKKITPIKIIIKDTKFTEDDNDIEVNFRQALNRGSTNANNVEEVKTNEKTPKQNDDMVDDYKTGNTTIAIGTAIPEIISMEENKPQENVTSTEANGLYPTAVYNTQAVNTMTIANGSPDYFLLPPLLDDDWKNFTVTTDIHVIIENNTKPSSNSDNVTLSPLVNETESTIKGPYSAALYNNAEINLLSITTNSYTNGSPLPPPRDDRWRSFSSLREMLSTSNEFRPLAGLYYDGFLHRPLSKNPGFVPYNHYFL